MMNLLIQEKKHQKQKTFPVIEVFSSIQGEGLYAGQKHIFLRFDKCNIACTYCDELHKTSSNWTVDAMEEAVLNLLAKVGAHHYLSFTGGEPLLYTKAILALTEKLGDKIKYYLETNGNLPHKLKEVIDVIDVVAMDIKLQSISETENTFYENEAFLNICLDHQKEVFVKIVIGHGMDWREFEEALDILARCDARIPLILQPLTVKDGPEITIDALIDCQQQALKKVKDVRIVPRLHEIFHVQ